MRLHQDQIHWRAVLPFATALAVLALAAACSTAEKAAERGGALPESCEPQCVEGDCQDGEGVYLYEDCSRYAGSFAEGARSGQGTFNYRNGDVYAGVFRDGKRHGEGVYRFDNGDVYTGQFAEGVPQGRGVYRFADGRTLRGSYTGWESGSGTLREDGAERRCELRDGLLYCEAPPEQEQPAAEPKPEEDDAMSSEEQSLAPAETPVSGRLLVLYAAEGSKVERHGGILNGRTGMALFPGDRLESGPEAVDIQGQGGMAIRLRPFSVLRVPDDVLDARTLILEQGSVLVDYDSEEGDPPFQIRSAGARVEVDGTTFAVELDPETNTARVRVYEGAVTVSPDIPALDRLSEEEIAAVPELRELKQAAASQSVTVEANQQGGIGAEAQAEARELEALLQRARKTAEEARKSAEAASATASNTEANNGDEAGDDAAQGAFYAALRDEAQSLDWNDRAQRLAQSEGGGAQEFEESPQEKAERRLLITVSDEQFRRAAAADQGRGPSEASAEAVREQYEDRTADAAKSLESDLKKRNLVTREDLIDYYQILEVVTFKDGSRKAGSIVTQKGRTLILHAPDGVYRMQAQDVDYVDLFTSE